MHTPHTLEYHHSLDFLARMTGLISREDRLAQFEYVVEKDFDVDGVAASWADAHQKPAHRFWGSEDHTIDLSCEGDNLGTYSISAVSHDERLVAASHGSVIYVFDLKTRERRTEFRGFGLHHLDLLFRPCDSDTKEYTLVVNTNTKGLQGRMLDQPAPIDTLDLLNLSLQPVVSKLNHLHGVSASSPEITELRTNYNQALETLQSKLQSKDLVRLDGWTAGPWSFSSDGRLLAFTRHNQATLLRKHRPEQELPQICVYDMSNHTQRHVLLGHQDIIEWLAFSPDNLLIATASRDGTSKIFDVATGDCKHTIGTTGHHGRGGDWSPDSKHVLFSGMESEIIQGVRTHFKALVVVYSAEDACQIARFEPEYPGITVRHISWSSRNEIVVAQDNKVYTWRPFENAIVSTFSLHAGDSARRSFASVSALSWADGGKMLMVRTIEGTIEIWDQDKNVKWRMQRPVGLAVGGFARSAHLVHHGQALISYDQDGCLRFYNL
ncbi:WD40 repeat-like protein [Aureobasidium pullulans]|nr:WD40 repeat-like protein [Aureobasidium pullulans]